VEIIQSDNATPTTKPTFEACSTEVISIIARRKSSWAYVSIMEWNEVSNILLEHIWAKWSLYDPVKAKSLEHWANRVITNRLFNLRRDLIGRYSRPCIGGGKASGQHCVYNSGGTGCSFTASKKQCSECPLYAEWQKTREPQFNIKNNVALEYHAQEVSNIQGDFSDVDGIKKKLDAAMHEELTTWEWHIYKALYIDHLSPTETSEHLQLIVKTWKRAPRANEVAGYQSVLQHKRQLEGMMREWLRREDHIT
jgi:hypothetical protein